MTLYNMKLYLYGIVVYYINRIIYVFCFFANVFDDRYHVIIVMVGRDKLMSFCDSLLNC